MRYQDFSRQMKNFQVFSVADIRKVDSNFYPARLTEWQKMGYIKKLRRGYYMFSDTKLDEQILYLIANKLYSPSYVSFESALSYYRLIPEGVYAVTSACSKKSARFKTQIAEFSYYRIRPELMFGYGLQEIDGKNFKIADMEKAVLDYLYLHPNVIREVDFYEWRFNDTEFLRNVDLEKFYRYAETFNSRRLLAGAKSLIAHTKNSK